MAHSRTHAPLDAAERTLLLIVSRRAQVTPLRRPVIDYLCHALMSSFRGLTTRREKSEPCVLPPLDELLAMPPVETTDGVVVGTIPYTAPEVLLAAGVTPELCRRASDAADALGLNFADSVADPRVSTVDLRIVVETENYGSPH